jgi:hypothetical protein
MSRLFELLPAYYRMRDNRIAQSQALLSQAELAQLQNTLATIAVRPLTPGEQQQLDQLRAKAARGPLQSLLMLVEEQLALLAENLDQLYDDQFIETCAPWVIPYIGDLIGFQTVNGIAPAVASPRAEVAHTISVRRRKGTVLAMEQLARDVTGWGAHAVEFFQALATTQYMNHPRPQNHSPDVSRWKTGFYIDTGFDRTPHTLDVRRIAVGSGRYNVQNIGIFLWSLNAYSLTLSPASAVAGSAQCFRFSPLGLDMPLFNNPVSQGVDITAAAGPVNVPARLRRRVLCDDLRNGGAAYYGEGSSLALYVGGQLLNAGQIQVCNLSGPDGSWIHVPAAGSPYAAAIDPELGRIALAPSAAGSTPQVQASFYYGFNADMGGGEYARQATFLVQDDALPFPDPRYAALQDALAYAQTQLKENGKIAVEITNSGVYTASALTVDLPAGATMELRAADGSRPTLFLTGEIVATGAPSSVFALNGIVIGATVHAPAARSDGTPNQLSRLSVNHCTLIPGGSQPTLLAEPAGLQVVVGKSILGAIRVAEALTATLADSIVDAASVTAVAYSALDNASGGGVLTLTGCTVVGKIHATLLNLVSNSIIRAASVASEAPLWSDRRQTGCVRFSYLPAGSVTPRQFDCVEQGPQSPQPQFFSLQYGDPAYSKLLASTPDAVRSGADDGGEMGAFHFVLAPLREADLRVRLQEYVPAGMEFGIIYQD